MVPRGRKGQLEGTYDCGILCDVIHAEGAEVVAEYGSDYYQGMPSLTVNSFGQGRHGMWPQVRSLNS